MKKWLNEYFTGFNLVEEWQSITKWKIVVALGFYVVAFFLYDIPTAILWYVFISFLLFDLDNRLLGGAAILSLVSCPILLALDTDWSHAWAEQMAVYAFFFLVMTVVLQLIDLKRHPEEDTE